VGKEGLLKFQNKEIGGDQKGKTAMLDREDPPGRTKGFDPGQNIICAWKGFPGGENQKKVSFYVLEPKGENLMGA